MIKRVFKLLLMLIPMTEIVQAQSADTLYLNEAIKVLARPSKDSITLRWAPLSFSTWDEGNKHGYFIERFTLIRDGKLVRPPEKNILTNRPVKVWPESQWESIITRDHFTPVAAQALFGERFEIDLGQSDIFTIVNKVKENEQRFAFSLFSADMSVLVAKASGLWFTDKNVKKNEKYLYRVGISDSADSLRGSVFVGSQDDYYLPKPENPKAEFKEQLASLRWDRSPVGTYTAFVVERSVEGKSFAPTSDIPLVTVSPTELQDTRYEYATDSLPDISKTYSYRIKGVTPFGELSDPSDVVVGKGNVPVESVPYINAADNVQNTAIQLSWDFPEKYNPSIKGFTIERSSKPRGNFTSIVTGFLTPATRQYEDKSPKQVNYYQVTAHAVSGEQFRSPLYFASLVDSIPPVAPVGLKAMIDEFGTVTLSWNPNEDRDIYGYRVYKGNTKDEEFAQITNEPIYRTAYTDKVNLNSLSESAYYRLMAIDINQNHSALSEILKVSLPDKVKPQPPVFLPVKSSNGGVTLSWIKSSSDDVAQYDVYRKATSRHEWLRLKVIQASEDSVYEFVDANTSSGNTNHYTVTAIDDAGLESEPATPVSGGRIDNELRPAMEWEESVVKSQQKQVVLKWKYEQNGVQTFQIYKSVDGEALIQYKSVEADKRELVDMLTPGKEYQFVIMAVFENSNKSRMSEKIVIKF